MTTRTLPPSVSAELLRSLSPKEFILVAITFGLEQVTKRLADGADDDVESWEFLVNRIHQLEAQRSAARG